MGGRFLCALALLVAATVLATAAPAAAAPEIHAHRGGPVVDGDARFGENTMPAFEHAHERGWVVELDVKLTKNRVPVVLHDATLDRTTDCTGPVAAMDAGRLRRECGVDVVGHPDAPEPTSRRVPVPTLKEVLDWARESGARLNVEIKNIPTDPDFDPTTGFAETVVDVLAAAELPSSQLIVQSFWPANLEVSERRLPRVPTSLLTLNQLNEPAGPYSLARDHEWVSPQWPASRAAISAAHATGRQVVPFTLDTKDAVQAATRAGVDAIISNDPALAEEAALEAAPERPGIPAAPSTGECEGTRAATSLGTIHARLDDNPSGPRVFAMQFHQHLRHVGSYADFRRKIECMVLEHVVPHLADDRPNVVAFNEDVGLMTIATGTRGRAVREAFSAGPTPSCESQGAPCATLAALAAMNGSYARELAAYRKRFPGMSAVSAPFVAATDTFARGWMQTFSDIARRYGVYILGSNNQAPFRASTDPAEIAEFADPDLGELPDEVYVATDDAVYNEVFLWGPKDVRTDGPPMLRNVVSSNKKVPLTPIEQQIELTPGASTGPDAIENLRPYALPETPAAKIGFATSLPAFVYGPKTAEPCADVSQTYMRCLDALGTTIVMQDEANPGRWATGAGNQGVWQPLEWMISTWRAVSDPTVGFTYNVTPHMVGNLADLVFDGQTAITQRGLTGTTSCHYVGNGDHEDNLLYPEEGGAKTEFLAMAPWVAPDAPRDELRAEAAKRAPGSGDARENDYVETAIVADLPFPADPDRPNCRGVTPAG